MRNRITPLFVNLVLALSAPNLMANESNTQWFTAATLSVGAADLHNTSHRNTLGNGMLIGGFVDGRLNNSRAVDTVAGIGGSIGVVRNRWQFETEALWRVRTDWDLSAPMPSIRTVTNVQTNLSNTTLLFNLNRRWGSQTQGWQWHTGFGVGIAFNRFETRYKERAIPGETQERLFTADSKTQELAWTVSAGVERQFSRRWQGRVRYRYIDLGEITVSGFRDATERRNARFVGRHSVHELQLTLIRFSQRQ